MATYPDIDAALYTALDASIVDVYREFAPDGAALPYVIFYLTAGGPTNTEPGIVLDQVYRVESRGSTQAEAFAAHQAVYAALHNQTLNIAGWGNYWTACEGEVRLFPELYNGNQLYRTVWDIRIKAAEEA